MNRRLLMIMVTVVAATVGVIFITAMVWTPLMVQELWHTSHRQSERRERMKVFPKEYRGRPLVWIPKLDSPGALTGDLSASAWRDAAALTLNDPATGQAPKYETTARVFCTDSALYFGFRCAEPSAEPLVTKGEFWNRDEVEIFIEPYKDTLQRPYHQIMVDAAGNAEFSRMHVYKRYFEEHALTEDWKPKVETKMTRDGGAWTVEVKIPFDQLKLSDDARAKRTLWRLNVCRIRPKRGEDLMTVWSWAPLGGSSFQWPARFGYALPETFESRELLEQAVTTAAAPADPSLARSKDPAVIAEIGETIPKLSLDAKDPASGASEAGRAAEEKLKELALVGPALYGVVEGALNETAKEAKARTGKVANYGAVRDFLFKLADWKPDEDLPPKSVLDKLAAWEPREVKDDAGNVVAWRLLKPKDFDASKKYPLFIWLHGSAERGTDNKKQLYSGVWEYAADDVRATYNCFIMAPQCPYTMGWADMRNGAGSLDAMKATSNYRLAQEPNAVTKILLATIEGLEKEFPSLDADRVYITGSSMGGFGAWELIMRRPDLFAAAAPICGGGDETQAARVAKLPIWMFHGEKDEAVKVLASRNMHAALKALGAPVFYREVPGAPHAIGDPTIRTDSLKWMFEQKRGR
jgi:predicted esterase